MVMRVLCNHSNSARWQTFRIIFIGISRYVCAYVCVLAREYISCNYVQKIWSFGELRFWAKKIKTTINLQTSRSKDVYFKTGFRLVDMTFFFPSFRLNIIVLCQLHNCLQSNHNRMECYPTIQSASVITLRKYIV